MPRVPAATDQERARKCPRVAVWPPHSLAPGGYATKPLGGAGKLLRNEVLWLAGRVNDPAPGEDIGKGLRLGEATPNLARNGDAEQGEDGRPAPGWGCYTGAGKGTWGTTTRAAHTGHKSVFLKALEPVTRKRRDRYTNKLKPVTLTSVALMQGESDGYRGPKAYDVLPDMRYRVSFWVKGDPANKPQPKITVFVQTWESEDGSVRSRKAIYPHNKARAFPVSPDWRRFAFTLHPRSPKARKMALKIQMAGDPATLPPGATIYVDDVRWVPEYVQGLQGVSIAGVRAGCEERVRPAWRRSRGPTPAITKLAVGTEMPINADGVPLRTALYDPKPEGWQRLDLAGMWKIKKLPGTRDNPANDLGAREACSYGSVMAGLALANARLGVVHGIAHPLGVRYHIPHGLCCGVLLPASIRLNRDAAKEKYALLSHVAGGDIEKVVESMLDRFGIPRTLAAYDIAESDFHLIAEESMPSGSLKANPKRVTEEDVVHILEQMTRRGLER